MIPIFGQELIITGVYDGSLTKGTPKLIELYASNSINDLSRFGIGSVTNGGESKGVELRLEGRLNAGDFLYISKESKQFEQFFGFKPDLVSNAANINGNDLVELFAELDAQNQGQRIDVFGVDGQNGSQTPWDYEDGWAYRISNASTLNQGNFVITDWRFSGPQANDDDTGTQSQATNPFPLGTYGNLLDHGTIKSMSSTTQILFPNPVTSGRLQIEGLHRQPATLIIYDALGNKQLEQPIINGAVAINALRPGWYLVRIVSKRGTTKARHSSTVHQLIVR